jgi:hypothetical protein
MDTKSIIEKYSDVLPLKLVIQNIPYIGTSLDTILSETGNKWREKRVLTFLQSFDERLKAVEISDNETILAIQNKVETEQFFDLFIQASNKSTMTYKKDKISRYANILKNYILKDLSSDDYLVEVFLDITDNLSENEIHKLSELQLQPLEVFYSYKDKPFDIERMDKDISTRKLSLDFNGVPKEYEYDDFYIYCYKRLEKLDLIKVFTVEERGFITVGWKSKGQSSTTQLQYKRKDEISLSDFGKKYIEWVIE